MTTVFQDYKRHYRTLLTLGLPIVVGQVGTIVLNFADTLMIGHHSTVELAAAAFVSNLLTLGLLIAIGFANGITPIVGRMFGQNDYDGIGSVVKNATVANTVLASVLVLTYAVLYFFLDKMGQPEELLPYMRSYYVVNLVSVPFVCWFNSMKQTFDGTAHTQIPMWVLLGGNMLNIFGNWVLIYGKLGLPELGLLGAGISTLTSRVVMAVAIWSVFFVSAKFVQVRQSFAKARVNADHFMQINRMGWPLGLQMGMESGAWSLCSIIVGWIGTNALAAHQIMLTVSMLFYQVYFGIAAAVSIKVSVCHGTRDYHSITPVTWAGFHLILVVAVLVSIPVVVFRGSMGYLFTDSADVAQIVSATIVPLLVYQLGDGLQCTFSNALRGLADVKPMMLVAFVSYFVVSIPCSYVFGIVLGGGLVGVWSAFPFGLTLAGLLYWWCFRRRLAWLRQAEDAKRGQG